LSFLGGGKYEKEEEKRKNVREKKEKEKVEFKDNKFEKSLKIETKGALEVCRVSISMSEEGEKTFWRG
jgi:hypothetical protein